MTQIGKGRVQTVGTPDGAFTIITDERGHVLASGWTDDHRAVWARIHPTLRPLSLIGGATDAADAVGAYYRGDPSMIGTVPVRQHGTELQRLGWVMLRSIPAGEPLTYTALAERLGRPQAVRAAASICARNAPALFVPCHRVLRSDGRLGGFAWGTEVKRSLLNREHSSPERYAE